MSSIEDGMRRTARDFDAFVAANVTMEWDLQKQKIFEHFGLVPKTGDGAAETTPGGGMSTFGSSSFGRNARTSHIGTPGGLKSGSIWSKSLGSSILGKTRGPASAQQAGLFADVDPSKHMQISRPVQLRQQSYAMAVRELNEARVAKNNYPIIQKFADITRKSGSDVVRIDLS